MAFSIRACTPSEVFNLSLFESHTVVDCRTTSAFTRSRIVSSASCPPPKDAHFDLIRDQLFESFIAAVGDELPEHTSPLVLVHDNNPLSLQLASILSDLVESFVHAGMAANANALGDANVNPFRMRLCGCKEIWLLDFVLFEAAFPTLCLPGLSLCRLRPTPRCVGDGFVFVCSNGCDVRQSAIDYNVTHVLSHTDPPLCLELTNIGKHFIALDVPGNIAEDHSQLWTACSQQACRMIQHGGRVLVRTRSTAASIACAAAILVRLGMPVREALQQLRAAFGFRTLSLQGALYDWASAQNLHALPLVLPPHLAV